MTECNGRAGCTSASYWESLGYCVNKLSNTVLVKIAVVVDASSLNNVCMVVVSDKSVLQCFRFSFQPYSFSVSFLCFSRNIQKRLNMKNQILIFTYSYQLIQKGNPESRMNLRF